MARLEGITGGLSGKMGSAVFRQSGGKTIASQYQPIVKNPNSEGQQAQRAKFKLMSQLAAVMAPGFGTMSVTTRKAKGKPSQRNTFTQLNFPLVEVSSENEITTAKVPMEQLKLTSSFRVLGSIAATPKNGGFTIDIQITDAAVKSARIVVVGYTASGGVKQAAIHSITDVPRVNGGDISFEPEDLVAGDYTVLAYGLIPTESAAGKISLDNIHTPADEDFVSAVELDKLVSEGAVIETMTIGVNTSASA